MSRFHGTFHGWSALLLPVALAAAACGSPAAPGTAGTAAASRADRSAPDSSRFWIGDVGPADGPLDLGPKQYPFICGTVESGLGQPVVDNTAGRGNAVFPETGGAPDFTAAPVGYSERCGLPTRVDYYYWDGPARDFRPFDRPRCSPRPPPASRSSR